MLIKVPNFLFYKIYYLFWICSGVSAEGSGVIVEGSVPITEETVATPPPADTKASTFLSYFGFL